MTTETKTKQKKKDKLLTCYFCGQEHLVPANTRVKYYVCEDCPPIGELPKDKRVLDPKCPLCGSDNIRITHFRDYPFGDSVDFQCLDCLSLTQTTNNKDGLLFTVKERVNGGFYRHMSELWNNKFAELNLKSGPHGPKEDKPKKKKRKYTKKKK